MKVRVLVGGAQYAGAQYGLIGAALFFCALVISPRYGPPLLWAAIAVHLFCGGVICWRRMRLWLASAAMFLGAPNLLALAAFQASGRQVFNWPAGWLAFAGISLVVAGGCFIAEPHVHPRRWEAWSRYMADKSGWDILLYRHIPDLHHP